MMLLTPPHRADGPVDDVRPPGASGAAASASSPGTQTQGAPGATTSGPTTQTPAPQDSTGTQSAPHRQGVLHTWLDGWWRVAMLGLNLLTAPLALVLAILTVVGVATIPAAGTGLLILLAVSWGVWGMAWVQRHVLAAFTGVTVTPPPGDRVAAWRRWLGLDTPRLRALGWTSLHAFWGLLSGSLIIFLTTRALLLFASPLLAPFAPEAGLRVLWWVRLDSPIEYAVAVTIGAAALLLVPFLARGLSGVDITLAQWLLGTDQQKQLREMSQRVQTLTTSRTETIDSVEAERRRIERDLHDGPQQRLVSIAMNLGLAKSTLDRDPDGARALIDEAHASSKEAIVEMRQVARGIVPPILTDRGLDAAVSALAARSSVPVTVHTRQVGRLDPTVEAIAYFSVSESLTNVAKHAAASRAQIELNITTAPRGPLLTVTVSDNGRGGARVGAGSGLTGLRQRVASVDGDLSVHSPPGAGTAVTITLPLQPGGMQ